MTILPNAFVHLQNSNIHSSLLYVNENGFLDKIPENLKLEKIQISNSVISQSAIFLNIDKDGNSDYNVKNVEGALLMRNEKVRKKTDLKSLFSVIFFDCIFDYYLIILWIIWRRPRTSVYLSSCFLSAYCFICLHGRLFILSHFIFFKQTGMIMPSPILLLPTGSLAVTSLSPPKNTKKIQIISSEIISPNIIGGTISEATSISGMRFSFSFFSFFLLTISQNFFFLLMNFFFFMLILVFYFFFWLYFFHSIYFLINL